MPRPEPFALVDTLREGSVSSASPDLQDPEALGAVTGGRSTPVGAGRLVSTPALLGGASRDGVSGYPIQVGKVQAPPLREETLARHRLLDWLDVKIHNRVVFVIADAGYGKTTLLADFSRRTRLRALWYRMDDEDRSWVTFLSYLVAAGREHDAKFAPRTHALLQDTGPGGPSRDEVVATFLRELPDIAPNPTVLILDDFHVADGSGDVSYAAKALITHAPERLTIVISSRRTPEVPVGRLRAQGELAELRTRDLQFSESEIADLFSANEGQPLDRESLGLLNRRSEGWAASLQLVRTAVRDRSQAEVRDFIKGLTGDQAELYDYLAEEVVGDLRPAHQEFLMKTSLLQTVTIDAASAATGQSSADVLPMVELSERLGLLSKQGEATGGYRYHPLVREFLESRLQSAIGSAAVRDLHLRVAKWAETPDWRAACHHYEMAGDVASIHRVIDQSIDVIAGQGHYELASGYLDRFPPPETSASFEVIASRMELRRGNVEVALEQANVAVGLQPNSDAAVNNAITMNSLVGNYDASWDLARKLVTSASTPLYRSIAVVSCAMFEASIDGRLADEIRSMEDLARQTEAQGLTHFAGVSHLNLSLAEQARGDSAAAYRHADQAISQLTQTYEVAELTAALLARATASAYLGNLALSRDDISSAGEIATRSSRPEWLLESAEVEAIFGSFELARSLLEEARTFDLSKAMGGLGQVVEARLAIRSGDTARASEVARGFMVGRPTDQPGFKSRQLALRAHAAIAANESNAAGLLDDARRQSVRQGSAVWERYCQFLSALYASGDGALDALIRRTSDSDLPILCAFAERVCHFLIKLEPPSLHRVTRLAAEHPERWLPALRQVVIDSRATNRWAAADVLDLIGSTEDVPILRALARSSKNPDVRASLGRNLARRLAPRYFVEDLGHVQVTHDGLSLPSSAVRRKVLAMLCFLLTKPRFAATRDEVIDALWPDLGPDVAVNSLNQTVYFLRRVFEPTYADDISAEYVHHTSDVLRLDRDLISSRSSRCLGILDALKASLDPSEVGRLSLEYTERFALDFAYEEWAVPFRTSLHVGYLQVIEAAVTDDMATGHHDRAIDLARRALDIDGSVESLELALLRLYRTTGAHAAAAEQYGHYASVLRDELGLDAPPLSSL